MEVAVVAGVPRLWYLLTMEQQEVTGVAKIMAGCSKTSERCLSGRFHLLLNFAYYTSPCLAYLVRQ